MNFEGGGSQRDLVLLLYEISYSDGMDSVLRDLGKGGISLRFEWLELGVEDVFGGR